MELNNNSRLKLLNNDKDLIPAIQEFQDILDKYKDVPHLEIEIRFGFIEDYDDGSTTFDTNIGSDFNADINNILCSYNKWKVDKKTVTTDYYVNTEDGKVRLSIDNQGNRSAMMKIRLEDIDFTYESGPFDIRISISQEIPKDPSDISLDEIIISRSKNRSTKKFETDNLPGCIWSFELSEVTTVNNALESKSFEFELELDNPIISLKNCKNDKQWLAHSTFLKIRQLINFIEEPEDLETQMVLVSRKKKHEPINEESC